jgi:hypothetical protein
VVKARVRRYRIFIFKLEECLENKILFPAEILNISQDKINNDFYVKGIFQPGQ